MKKVKRSFKGIWIPKEIWEADLPIQEKVFLAEIDSLDNDNGCFASNAYFAEFFKLTKSRCSQIIANLERKRLISIKLNYNGKQIIGRTISLTKGVVNILNRGSKNIDSIEHIKENKKEEKKNCKKKNQPTLILVKTTNPKYLKLANKLYKIIKTKKRIVFTKIQIKSWADEFRKLETINKVNINRQKEALKWYKENIGNEYVPVIESGKSFRDKFVKLEAAITRNSTSSSAPKLTNTYNGNTYKLKKDEIEI